MEPLLVITLAEYAVKKLHIEKVWLMEKHHIGIQMATRSYQYPFKVENYMGEALNGLKMAILN